jgi:threonine dehydrogenase-like Zn-dependent dehydrogenase
VAAGIPGIGAGSARDLERSELSSSCGGGIDASNAAHLPALAIDLVEPAGRVVYIGLAGSPSHIDTRTLALKDVTAVGVLSGSSGLDATIAAYARGAVDPRPLVSATVGLEQVGAVAGNGRRRPARPQDPCRSTAQLRGF